MRDNPSIERVRDMYSWATGWDAGTHDDRPDLANLQQRLRAEFDRALAEHDADLIESLAGEFSTVMHPYEGGVTGWLRAKAQERREQ